MNPTGRMMWLLSLLTLATLAPGGCTQTPPPSVATTSSHTEMIRVRLLQDIDQVNLSASVNPRFTTTANPFERELILHSGTSIPIALTRSGWTIGSLSIGGGILTLRPGAGGMLAINNQPYRGSFRLVPIANGKFDVVNDLDIDSYLKGVLAKELYPDWRPQAYEAQAVVARTYAMYIAHTEGLGRYWDVFPDQRSQVYGGIAAETDKSRDAVDSTAGWVLTYGEGNGRYFEAYFSSCCGGITQSASDVFPGDAYIPPLGAQLTGSCCSMSPHYNWGPITIKKDELTRRIRLWGGHHVKPRLETTMAEISKLELDAVSPYGRPIAFKMTDAKGVIYHWSAEEMRSAVNTDAPPGSGTTLFSSFCKVSISPNKDTVVFFDGHGYGHGIGMCQWCAEARAVEGQSYETIVLAAFPQAKLARAY